MSYSFTITATTKDEAKTKIAEEFDKVVSSQPSHATDRDAAVAAGQAFVDILTPPDTDEEVYLMMYGSLSWTGQSDDYAFTSGNVSVTASVRAKQSS